jgi:hypothetical protein
MRGAVWRAHEAVRHRRAGQSSSPGEGSLRQAQADDVNVLRDLLER